MASSPGSHTRFAILNRTVNPLLGGLLRSPAHRLVSDHLVLIRVTGRRTGKTFTFPVAYSVAGDHVTIGVGWPERKRWWRNLREEAPVELWLRGVHRTGMARAYGDEDSGVRVEVALDPVGGSSAGAAGSSAAPGASGAPGAPGPK
jgi:F420H(2)-dependent quinone reductase